MRILLTNDDGLHAPGLRHLYRALVDSSRLFPQGTDADDGVVVVAPSTVQSATSHGVTFDEPLMVRRERVCEGMHGVAVDGRPADCVKLALSCLWPERFGEGTRPDLVVSGMNSGANCGINVIYSGTVAAAIEAAFLGIPSIAVSLHLGKGTPRWDVAAHHAEQVIVQLLDHGLGNHECLNVNLPRTEAEGELPPVRVAAMNAHGHMDAYERRRSPLGDDYYWATGSGLDFHETEAGSDVDELFRKRITVTPLQYDLTRHPSMDHWRQRLDERRGPRTMNDVGLEQ